MQISEINSNSSKFPKKLNHLHSPPKSLRFIGEDLKKQLKSPSLAIVGSRKVSSYGRMVTEELASAVAKAGVCVISGLALGVDSIAHKAAIEASGQTIAVLPSGISTIYPASHRGLAREILKKKGTLVSEYSDDFRPRKESFIERNRIIAGLADALLVTEAAQRSGSLYTARFALDIGKPVLAIPGNINSPTSQGTNNLIKSGAIMITCEQDIFEALGADLKVNEQKEIYGDNKEETRIIKLISGGFSNGSEIHAKSGLSVDVFNQTITMLEIKGVIHPLGNNNWALK